MAILFSDNFNRADSTDLGANWTEQLQDWEILTNQLRLVASTNEGIAVTTTTAHPAVADVSVSAKFVQVDVWGGIIARSTATPDTQYIVVNDAPNSIQLWKKVAGVLTLIQGYAPTTSTNATVRLECEGTVQRVYYNDSLQTPTGADTEITQTGQTGFRTGTSPQTYDFDDFVVSDFRPTAPQVDWPLPVAAAARPQAFTALNLLTTTLGVVVPAPAPFVPQLWPVSYALKPSPDFIGRARVEGRDRFFAGEGRAPTPQEWSITRLRAMDRGSFVSSSLRLQGRDRFFGGEGYALDPPMWPVTEAKRSGLPFVNVNLLGTTLGVVVPAPAPFLPFLWPMPSPLPRHPDRVVSSALQTMTMVGLQPVKNDLWPLSRPLVSMPATWVQRFQLTPPGAAGPYQPMRMTLLGVT